MKRDKIKADANTQKYPNRTISWSKYEMGTMSQTLFSFYFGEEVRETRNICNTVYRVVIFDLKIVLGREAEDYIGSLQGVSINHEVCGIILTDHHLGPRNRYGCSRVRGFLNSFLW